MSAMDILTTLKNAQQQLQWAVAERDQYKEALQTAQRLLEKMSGERARMVKELDAVRQQNDLLKKFVVEHPEMAAAVSGAAKTPPKDKKGWFGFGGSSESPPSTIAAGSPGSPPPTAASSPAPKDCKSCASLRAEVEVLKRSVELHRKRGDMGQEVANKAMMLASRLQSASPHPAGSPVSNSPGAAAERRSRSGSIERSPSNSPRAEAPRNRSLPPSEAPTIEAAPIGSGRKSSISITQRITSSFTSPEPSGGSAPPVSGGGSPLTGAAETGRLSPKNVELLDREIAHLEKDNALLRQQMRQVCRGWRKLSDKVITATGAYAEIAHAATTLTNKLLNEANRHAARISGLKAPAPDELSPIATLRLGQESNNALRKQLARLGDFRALKKQVDTFKSVTASIG